MKINTEEQNLKDKSICSNGHMIDFGMLPEDAVIVDGGVCQGEFINELHLGTDPKKFKIIGFEASPQNIANMPTDFKGISDMQIYNKILVGEGFASHEKFVEYEGLEQWGNMGGMYDDTARRRKKQRTESMVETITLKKIFDLHNLERIDYLKLDIEGSEFDLVDTMTPEVAKKIKQLSMEVHSREQEHNHMDVPEPVRARRLRNAQGDLADKLRELGFHTYALIQGMVKNELYAYRI